MTQASTDFLTALNATIKDFFPIEKSTSFQLQIPLDTLPAKATYPVTPNHNSAHEKIKTAMFLKKIEDLFEPENPGAEWLKTADFLQKPAENFGFHTEEEIASDSFQTRHISPENKQPTFTFHINPKRNQIESVTFQDGTLFKGQKNPAMAQFKTLIKQQELQRFFHLISYFKGPLYLWRTYYFRINLTLRAPDRASACFLTQAFLNANKAMKSDSYEIENAYRIFCSPIETEETIQAYQEQTKAMRIL